METMFMQNFGGTNKEYYGIFETGLLSFHQEISAKFWEATENFASRTCFKSKVLSQF